MIDSSIDVAIGDGRIDQDELPPLAFPVAATGVGRCVARSVALLAGRKIRQPKQNAGLVVSFADGSHGRVYRETVPPLAATDPVALVVEFRLRWIRGWGHRLFRA